MNGIVWLAFVGLMFFDFAIASAKVQSFETKRPICIQNGPSMIKSIGAAYAAENTLKHKLKDGQIEIPAGCAVEVETVRELLGTESQEQLARLMYVPIIMCDKAQPMTAGGASFFGLMFDTKGCLEGAFNSTELQVCGKTEREGQRINFKNGLLDCSDRKSVPRD